LAVEAPFFVPKSIAAVPEISESGMYTKNPIANIPNPIPARDNGINGNTTMSAARQNNARTETGMRLD